LARLRRIQVESTGTTINFRPAAITHRDIRSVGLADRIQTRANGRRKTSRRLVDPQGYDGPDEAQKAFGPSSGSRRPGEGRGSA
jgi:hypothetical protein